MSSYIALVFVKTLRQQRAVSVFVETRLHSGLRQRTMLRSEKEDQKLHRNMVFLKAVCAE